MKKCDYCGGKLSEGRKRFCCNKHKDRYHNLHNPRGIFAHLADKPLDYRSGYDEDDVHPFSCEGLGQWQ